MANTHETNKQHIYHIRVAGELDEKWADWFEGFVMASRENGETLLSGAVVDQAALHGVLDRIHSLGLPLLLVVQTDCPCSKKNCPRRGQCRECAAYHAAKKGLPFCLRPRNKWDKRCAALTQAG
jgi:hypothetical protein